MHFLAADARQELVLIITASLRICLRQCREQDKQFIGSGVLFRIMTDLIVLLSRLLRQRQIQYFFVQRKELS